MRYISTWASRDEFLIATIYKNREGDFKISINGDLLNRDFPSLQDAEGYLEILGYEPRNY